MKKFDVTIRATITKTMRVEAETEEDAVIQAHEDFDVTCDGNDESYEQDLLEAEEVKEQS